MKKKILYLFILFLIIFIFLKKTNLFQSIKEFFYIHALHWQDSKRNDLIKKWDFEPKFVNETEKKEIEKIFLKRIKNNNNKLFEEKYNNILLNIRKRLKKKKDLNKKVRVVHKSDPNYLNILHTHYILKIPLVIKGYSFSPNYNKLDKLIDRYGDYDVLFSSKENKDFNFYDKLKTIKKKNKRSYGLNISRFSTKEEYKSLPLEEIKSDLYKIRQNTLAFQIQLFISTIKGTGAPFHCANDNNFFCMCDGRKKWCFVNPAYTHVFSPYFVPLDVL